MRPTNLTPTQRHAGRGRNQDQELRRKEHKERTERYEAAKARLELEAHQQKANEDVEL
jgi:hypothetical protein